MKLETEERNTHTHHYQLFRGISKYFFKSMWSLTFLSSSKTQFSCKPIKYCYVKKYKFTQSVVNCTVITFMLLSWEYNQKLSTSENTRIVVDDEAS